LGRLEKRLLWSQPARCDLIEVRSWAERYLSNREAAALAEILRREIERLVDFPRLGVRVANPDGGSEEIRELVVRRWVVRYVVDDGSVIVVRLWDSRRAVKRGELRDGPAG